MKVTTPWENWQQWREERWSHLPVAASWPCARLPGNWHPFWRGFPFSALLETGKAGRYTIICPQIRQLLLAFESRAELIEIDAEGSVTASRPAEGPALHTLRRWAEQFKVPQLPYLPFTGGLVGYFSYDLVRTLERLPRQAMDDLGLPLAAWGLAQSYLVFDHKENVVHAVALSKTPQGKDSSEARAVYVSALAEVERLRELWEEAQNCSEEVYIGSVPASPAAAEDRRFSLGKAAFQSAVLRVQDFIRSGDTYQVNLSIRETRSLQVSPEDVYEQLRRINPSPYMAFLRLPEFALVSGSPELLVRLREGVVEARPIAGTRPRGTDDADDSALAAELMENEKERAEHLMLVDLIRNDLGRISRFGSVQVSEFMSVEKYSHVMHIVSQIRGELAAGKNLFDVIAATFPGGTITGAPKVRTMEIIEELEPVRRGPYTGSIGWLGFNGEMELNITIRTLVAAAGLAHVQAGAGIVIDSDPEREYVEAINKAKALWAAVTAAESCAATALAAR